LSLRARLIGGLLAVTAVGLLALGGTTYVEQRHFLQQRIDQQARAAVGPVSASLEARGVNVPGYPRRTRGPGGDEPGRGEGPRGPGRGGRDGGPIDLPPGTYGERRDASGRVLGHVYLTYGGQALPTPVIPRRLKVGSLSVARSRGSSGLRWRVLAARTERQPGTTVVAVPMKSLDETLHRLVLVEALVIGGMLLALALASWVLVRLGLRPLDRIGSTADAIAAGDLSRRVSPATPRTEVGRLGIALNRMLARLEEAFADRAASEARLRRFIADASHELRTPLTAIRGYAELFRTGAAREPAETARAMQRIEDEASRMGGLVEDLLALARLDELPDAVRADVDLARLAGDAVDDARAVDPGRRIDLHGDDPALVCGDPHQLRQVLANLMRNALVHTPPGTPVDVTVCAGPSHTVRVEVRDHGPGLPTDDPSELFERFWRAESGRERGRAGAGLGLAIVAAIVAAHQGTARAENAPDGGARFVIELPARAAVPAAPVPA
jgi:two-component system OmpR family sensor kinase